MEYRQLGNSGLKVPVLSFGAGTFGGKGEFFKAWGSTDTEEATRLLDICLDAGVNLFDTADIYSRGESEKILGKAIGKRRSSVLISTKTSFAMGDGPNDLGSSRHHLIESCEASLKRLNTDYIDIYHMHGFDALTPVEEVLKTLDTLVTSGKVRYIACSNFSGWHLMKSLSVSDRFGWSRYVAHQVYYSLIGRDYESELMPLALDQKVAAIVWSPLGWGRLTGKIRRNQPLPKVSRLHSTAEQGPPVADEYLFKVVDALDEVAKETGKSIPQIALNWLLQRPSVANVIIGARTEEQLRQNLAAAGWNLTTDQVARLDAASAVVPPIHTGTSASSNRETRSPSIWPHNASRADSSVRPLRNITRQSKQNKSQRCPAPLEASHPLYIPLLRFTEYLRGPRSPCVSNTSTTLIR